MEGPLVGVDPPRRLGEEEKDEEDRERELEGRRAGESAEMGVGVMPPRRICRPASALSLGGHQV